LPLDNNGYYGQRDLTSDQGGWNQLRFSIWQQINQMATSHPVQVMAVRPGGTGPVGQVDIRILVQQVSGDGATIDHGTISNVPYVRLQGGSNAVIIDPAVGDIGLASFCSRDISAVKNARAVAPPGSHRAYDFSDAIYMGGCLNGTPAQYVQFTDSGIVIHSPTAITVEAPSVTVTASGSAAVQSPSVSLGSSGGALHALVDERILSWASSHTHKVTAVGSDTATPTQALPSATTSATKAS
jgi:hypothetical protein